MHADDILLSLGCQLRQARRRHGLTQAQVASLAGLPRLKVIQVEAGRPSVSVEAYTRVAAALGMTILLSPATRPTLDDLDAANARSESTGAGC